jgi:peptidoglycan/LPS O-acetylase OafA/YrhL
MAATLPISGFTSAIPTSSGFRLGQRPALDGLRGLAALAVLLTHFGLFRGGVLGLECLFVLSGFLISVLLIEEHQKTSNIALGKFYRRRFQRVLPPLIALLVIVTTVQIVLGARRPGEIIPEALRAGFFLGNLQSLQGFSVGWFGHTWSLALEVQFYLLWPVLFYFLLRANVRPKFIVMLTVLLIAASMGLRIAMFTQRPPSGPVRMQYFMRLYMGLDTHCDTLLIGCLLGTLVMWYGIPETQRFRSRLKVFACLSLAVMGYMLFYSHHEQEIYYCGLATLMGLLNAAVIASLLFSTPRVVRTVLESRPMVGLGRISYALYLYHIPVFFWMRPDSLGMGFLAVVICILAATVSFYALEKPFLGRKPSTQSRASAETTQRPEASQSPALRPASAA